MTLIAIVLALILERMLSYSPAWRAHDLTERWMRWLDERLGSRSWSLAAYVLGPVCVVALLDHLLTQQPAGMLLGLPLSLLVLLACLGPRDLREHLLAYENAVKKGDTQQARSLLNDLLKGPRRTENRSSGRSAVSACFVQGHERWFAVLFWFFLLGPAGAVAYRVLATVAYQLRLEGCSAESLRLADWLHGAMAWPSARMAGLCYALAGSADHAYGEWREWAQRYEGIWVNDAWPFLATIGVAALAQDVDEPASELACIDGALRLLSRSLILFLAILALFTIGGWLA